MRVGPHLNHTLIDGEGMEKTINGNFGHKRKPLERHDARQPHIRWRHEPTTTTT
jgi:hypothetical protein